MCPVKGGPGATAGAGSRLRQRPGYPPTACSVLPVLSAKGLQSGLHPQPALVLPAPPHVGEEQGDTVGGLGTVLWARHRLLGDPSRQAGGADTATSLPCQPLESFTGTG